MLRHSLENRNAKLDNHYDECSNFLDSRKTSKLSVEGLRQVEGAKVANNGWVRGDA